MQLFSVNGIGLEEIIPSMICPSVKRCYSPNLHKFFTRRRNRKYCRVLRHCGRLWFATIWDQESGWTGVSVSRVASYGEKAETGWYMSQLKECYEDVTEWFWTKYLEEGMYGHYEVWHRSYPEQLTHREVSQL